MKYILAAAVTLLWHSIATAQCYDAFGRARVCPNTPSLQQRGLVNFGRNNSSAAVAESYREPLRVYPGEVNGKIRLEFWQMQPPDEIVIQGQVWRRVR